MPRVPRFDSFPIEPAAILTDHAFMVMSHAAQLAYLKLLFNLWGQKEPGVIPDNDHALSNAAGLGLPEWQAVRAEVAPALNTKKRPGFWISPKMIETHAAQRRWYEAKQRAGRVGGKASVRSRLSSTRSTVVEAAVNHSSTGGVVGGEGGGAPPVAVRVAQSSALAGSGEIQPRAHVPEGEVNTPREGTTQNGLVWFLGGWRSQSEAEFLGW